MVSPMVSMLMTVEFEVSEPVPARVEMAPIFAILSVLTLPRKRSSSSKSLARP